MTFNVPVRAWGWPVALTLALFVSSACSNAQTYISKGDKLFEQKHYEAAIVEYRNAVREDPNSAPSRQKLARTALTLGLVADARREFVRAADLLPQDVPAQLDAAEALLRTSEFPDASERAKKVLALDPKNSRAHLLMGMAAAGMNNAHRALEDVRKALELDPRLAEGYSNLGVLELAQGRAQEAEAALKQAAALAPEATEPQLALADFYWRTGQSNEAEKAALAAVARKPTDFAANRALGLFYVATGRAAEAETPFTAAAANQDQPEGALGLADYYVARGRSADARPILEQLAGRPEARAAARARIAGIDYTEGRRDIAHSSLDALIKEAPRNAQLNVLKGTWLLRENRTDEALAAAKAAVTADPDSVAAAYLLAMTHDVRREFAAAAEAYGTVIKLSPRLVQAQVALARVNVARNNPNAAVTFARDAVQNAPSDPVARLTLVRTLRVQRNFTQANSELDKLMQQSKPNAVLYAERGALAMAQSDLALAATSFQQALKLNPNSVDAISGLNDVDLANRTPDRAVRRAQEALDRNPKSVQMLASAARTFARTGSLAKAETLLNQALELDARYLPAYHLLGQIYVQQNRLEDARQRYEGLINKQPDNVGAHTMVGMLLEVQGRQTEARARYEKVLQLDGRAAVAANNIAYMDAEAGTNLDVALQLAQIAKAEQPDDPDFNDTLGWVYYKKDLANLAIGPLKSSVDKVPDHPIYRYHLGMAYLKTGDKRGAREMLQEALRLDSRFDGADQARAALATLGS